MGATIGLGGPVIVELWSLEGLEAAAFFPGWAFPVGEFCGSLFNELSCATAFSLRTCTRCNSSRRKVWVIPDSVSHLSNLFRCMAKCAAVLGQRAS